MPQLLTPHQEIVFYVLTPEWQSTRTIVQAIHGPGVYEGTGYTVTPKVHRRVHKQLQRLWRLGLVDKEITVRYVQYSPTDQWMRRTSIWRVNGHE